VNHSDIQSTMAGYLDGTLVLEKRALFDGHLDQCQECTEELAEMRGTIHLLRTLPDPEPPADLVSNVMQMIREGEARPSFLERLGEISAALLSPKIAIPATALAAGLLVVAVADDSRIRIPGLSPSQTDRMATRTTNPTQIAGRPGSTLLGPATFPGPTTQPGPSGGERERSGVNRNLVAQQQPEASSLEEVVQRIEGPVEPVIGAGGESGLIRLAEKGYGPLIREGESPDLLFPARSPQASQKLGASALAGEASPLVAVSTDPTPTSTGGSTLYDQRFTAPHSPAHVPANVQAEARVEAPLPKWRDGLEDVPKADRRLIEMDRLLVLLVESPVESSQRLQATTLAERELWLKYLAERAVQTGVDGEVVDALRASGSPVASEVANAFEATLDRTVAAEAPNVRQAPQGEAKPN
jgi:hypothetical protein